jgi:putative ribosome biogenesis GTPase RsgA
MESVKDVDTLYKNCKFRDGCQHQNSLNCTTSCSNGEKSVFTWQLNIPQNVCVTANMSHPKSIF